MHDYRVELLRQQTHGPTDAGSIADRLDSCRIRLITSERHLRLSFSLANLLSRTFADVVIECPAAEVDVPIFGKGRLADVAGALISWNRVRRPIVGGTQVVVDVGVARPGADLYVSNDKWTVSLSETPHRVLAGNGPATVAASAIAAAEVFRRMFPEAGGVRLGKDPFVWNLLDYRLTAAPQSATFGAVRATCFGAGSVGSSLLYALILGDAHGEVAFIDPDRLAGRNRLRYPLWVRGGSLQKARWVEDMAAGSELTIRGYPQAASEYIRHTTAPAELAVCTVDNVAARRDVVDMLARTTLDAGVEALQFHVSRNGFGDGYACSYCSYVDVGDVMDEVQFYVEVSGLDEARIRELLAGSILTSVDLARMRELGILSEAGAGELEGGRLHDVARLKLYGEVPVALQGQARSVRVSAPFVAALAGSVLAAELLKSSTSSTTVLDRRIDIDCSGFPTGFQSRPVADRSGRCLCADPFRIASYKTQWPT
jgi:hypothetical protein